jgi:putative transposase
MIAFIDDHREAYGVEPICKVLPIAPSTYHAHIAQRIDASKRSARAQRDAELKIEVQRVFAENFGVYGARKVWRQLRRLRGRPLHRRAADGEPWSAGRDPWQARADDGQR